MAAQGLNGYPVETGMAPGSLAALNGGGGGPQVNATNQSALAPNGDINQSVTNTNHYENKYYNVSTTTAPYYGVGRRRVPQRLDRLGQPDGLEQLR